MSNFTASLNETYSVFLCARGWALGASDRALARRVRWLRWRRQRSHLGTMGRVRLKAYLIELKDRA